MNYTITKYAQSCFLIRKDGRHCLIDPGRFVDEMDKMKPEYWPKIDLILLTHEHSDHADIDGIRAIVERDHSPVITNASLASQLSSQGVMAKTVAPGASAHIGGFHIRGIAQMHGDLPNGRPKPDDIGFVVDSTFYTPGDSVVMPEMPNVDVLFVPVAGPQMNFATAKEMIGRVKPKLAIPMHYANTAHYPIDMDELHAFSVKNVELLVLESGQSFSWPRE